MTDDRREPRTRRDILYIATAVVGIIGVSTLSGAMVMASGVPAYRTAYMYIDLEEIAVGQQIKILWRGKPVFIRHRTPEEIERARAENYDDLPNSEFDIDRLRPDQNGNYHPEYLVVVGVCTHSGCVPVGEAGDYDGWYCPCHGSHFDTSGRVRKGPAPKNLVIPEYEYDSPTVIRFRVVAS